MRLVGLCGFKGSASETVLNGRAGLPSLAPLAAPQALVGFFHKDTVPGQG